VYLGQHQLGTYLDVLLQCRTTAMVASMPEDPPRYKVWRASDGALVTAGEMPLLDKDIQVGLFKLELFLGDSFATGNHSMELMYSISTDTFIETRTFGIAAGGDTDGQVLAMYYYHRPHADFVVYQVESGLILRGKNPRVQ
jgi:hypothetical protein